jgi:predicted nucleic acid-binding protein
MRDKVFFDTNVLVYALAQNDPRVRQAEALLAAGGIVSVQILNEFVAVARRKLQMSWSAIKQALGAIRDLCPSIVPITIETHEAALKIAQKYRYEIYDALIVAAALEAGCVILYSEDLQHRQIVDGQLTIQNPFKN